ELSCDFRFCLCEWFKNIVARAPDGLRWARGYDLAISTKTSADHTASFRCAKDAEGNLYIADGMRGRLEYPEQRKYVIGRMRAERNTRHAIENALHGQAFVQDLRRLRSLSHVPLQAVTVEADKFTRALAWASLAEAGKVILVRGPWIDDFLDEVCRFTGKNDASDDQVDAVSLAVRAVSSTRSKLLKF
ncbi:MAG: phage terminase large subunit, partial [Acidobacteriota bacterium]